MMSKLRRIFVLGFQMVSEVIAGKVTARRSGTRWPANRATDLLPNSFWAVAGGNRGDRRGPRQEFFRPAVSPPNRRYKAPPNRHRIPWNKSRGRQRMVLPRAPGCSLFWGVIRF